MKYQLNWKEYAKKARQVAAEGCVLLKNDQAALPVLQNEKVSVFGRMQFHYYKSGTGSGGMVNTPYVTNILEGLKKYNEVILNKNLISIYEEWEMANPFDMGTGWASEPWSQQEMPLSREIVREAAGESDVALVVIGRTAGEDKDNTPERGSYLLTEIEEDMIDKVCSEFSRVAVILNVGNIIDMKWVDKYQPQAVLYVWQGGMEGGNAAADVITGAVNPSGRLSDTIAQDIDDYPSTKNFGDAKDNVYEEDIYVGYRYFETFQKDKVLYPFGYGLSYTTFQYDKAIFEEKKDSINVKINIQNTGEISGKEVIQIYSCPPQGKLGKPLRNLIGYKKTKLLQPKEKQEIIFNIQKKEMASYDDNGSTGYPFSYVLEEGTYYIFAGFNVREAKPAGQFVIDETQVISRFKQVAAPIVPFTRIKPELAGDDKWLVKQEPVTVRKGEDPFQNYKDISKEAIYTGDKGYKLSDVYHGTVDMEVFLNQLSDEELTCLTRGEGMCSPKVTPGTASAFGGVTEELQSYGIPVACCADGPSGIRMDCGTIAFSLPNGTNLACTFDDELSQELYAFLGMELRRNQIDTILGPGMNIHRNPLNGRNFEYFSEDPLLTGKMAAAQLKGLHLYGVTGTLKHFACNNQEYKRSDSNSIVSERALREIYAKGYEIAVKEGNAYSIMSTYGALNGIWTAGHYDLLTTLLREEWGYDGIVMTDWWAKMNEEGKEASLNNTIPMVRAQNDLYMVVSNAHLNSADDNTMEGIDKNVINRKELIRNASNICKAILRLPVMERYLGNMDECEEIQLEGYDNKAEMNLITATVSGETILDVSKVDTKKGSTVTYALTMPQMGDYKAVFKMKADAVALAQLPMSVFFNNQFIKTISITGMNKTWITQEVELEVSVALNNFMKLYFGEGGIILDSITIIPL